MADLPEVRAQLRSQLLSQVLELIETAINAASEVAIAALHSLRPAPSNQPDMAFRWLDSFENRLRVLEQLEVNRMRGAAGLPQTPLEDRGPDCGKPLGKGVCRMPAGHDGPHMNMWRSEPQQPGEGTITEPGNTGGAGSAGLS
jgi:hypothetical protein